jgi:bifunctional non-homologous end joining protein LigD
MIRAECLISKGGINAIRWARAQGCPARRPDGIFVTPFEQGEIGPELFRAACEMGPEGLVSKRRDRPYQASRSKHWLKIKDRKHPATSRAMKAFG